MSTLGGCPTAPLSGRVRSHEVQDVRLLDIPKAPAAEVLCQYPVSHLEENVLLLYGTLSHVALALFLGERLQDVAQASSQHATSAILQSVEKSELKSKKAAATRERSYHSWALDRELLVGPSEDDEHPAREN